MLKGTKFIRSFTKGERPDILITELLHTLACMETNRFFIKYVVIRADQWNLIVEKYYESRFVKNGVTFAFLIDRIGTHHFLGYQVRVTDQTQHNYAIVEQKPWRDGYPMPTGPLAPVLDEDEK